MSTDGQGTLQRRKIAENFNRLSRAHERYRRQTTDRRQTDGRRHIANMNLSSRSLMKRIRRDQLLHHNEYAPVRAGQVGCCTYGPLTFMMKFIRHEGSEHTETYNINRRLRPL